MKRFILGACAGLLAVAMAAPSYAADMARPAYKAPVFLAPFNWSGFYVGINGGYGWGESRWTAPSGAFTTGDFDVKGAVAGGTVGYNLQTGPWVWGLEGDFDYSWIKGTTTVLCGSGCETQNTWLATGRGRIGYASDRWLPYITGGAAYGNLKFSAPGAPSGTENKFGWTAGAGLEYGFLGAWSTKLEYLYVDLGTSRCGATNCNAAADITFKTNIIRAGINYRF